MLNKATQFTLPHFIFHIRKSWHGTKSTWAEEACTKYGHLRHCTLYTHSCTHILEQVNNPPNNLYYWQAFSSDSQSLTSSSLPVMWPITAFSGSQSASSMSSNSVANRTKCLNAVLRCAPRFSWLISVTWLS